jgi:methylthioribulose-1-phosphate dehydratase
MTPEEAGVVLAAEAARFAGLGWMRGTSGNLSVVLSRDPLRLAVTASGRDKGDLSSADVVVVGRDGAAVEPTGGRPSAEAAFHAHVAGRHPGGIEVEGLEMLKGIGRQASGDVVRIPVIPNSQDMAELARGFDAAWEPGTPALVVATHGLYAWGADALQARHHTEIVEWLLEYLLHA